MDTQKEGEKNAVAVTGRQQHARESISEISADSSNGERGSAPAADDANGE